MIVDEFLVRRYRLSLRASSQWAVLTWFGGDKAREVVNGDLYAGLLSVAGSVGAGRDIWDAPVALACGCRKGRKRQDARVSSRCRGSGAGERDMSRT